MLFSVSRVVPLCPVECKVQVLKKFRRLRRVRCRCRFLRTRLSCRPHESQRSSTWLKVDSSVTPISKDVNRCVKSSLTPWSRDVPVMGPPLPPFFYTQLFRDHESTAVCPVDTLVFISSPLRQGRERDGWDGFLPSQGVFCVFASGSLSVSVREDEFKMNRSDFLFFHIPSVIENKRFKDNSG